MWRGPRVPLPHPGQKRAHLPLTQQGRSQQTKLELRTNYVTWKTPSSRLYISSDLFLPFPDTRKRQKEPTRCEIMLRLPWRWTGQSPICTGKYPQIADIDFSIVIDVYTIIATTSSCIG